MTIDPDCIQLEQLEFPLLQDLSRLYDASTPPDLLTFVPHPYARTRDIDPVSKIYQTLQATRTSPVIGIFHLFATMSYWNLKNGVTYRVALSESPRQPILWSMVLAPSGCSKTLQLKLMDKVMPREAELSKSFHLPASSLSVIQQFKQQDAHLWIEDEAAGFVRRIENESDPLHDVKQQLLNAKSGERLTYHSKSEGGHGIENPKLALLWVNTIKGMERSLSQQSLIDGFFSRFNLVMAECTPDLREAMDRKYPPEATNHLYDLREFDNSGLREDLESIFRQDIAGAVYDCTDPQAVKTFGEGVSALLRSFRWMIGDNSELNPFFDRLKMESWNYAIFHRQMYKKQGFVIDAFDIEFGLRVVRFHLCSLHRFMTGKAPDLIDRLKKQADVRTRKKRVPFETRVRNLIKDNPYITMRELCRRTSRSKSEIEKLLTDIRKESVSAP